MESFISIHITCPNKEIALLIGEKLVQSNLVACAQIDGPISSIYRWNKQVEQDEEWRLILKTIKKNFEQIEKITLSSHPFDVPQILSFKIENGFDEYLEWIETNSKPTN